MPTEPGREDVARHDADLALARCHDARAVRADKTALRAAEGPLDPDHVEDRNALGDADDERDLRIDRLEDRVGGKGRGHVDDAGVGAGGGFGLGDGVEDREAEMDLPALPRRDAADHLRAVLDGLLGMERAVLAGKALADDAGIGIDEDGHVDMASPGRAGGG